MVRILDRYIARDMLVTSCIGVALLGFTILVQRIMLLVDLVVAQGAAAAKVLLLFLYTVPLSLVISVPSSVLLAGIAVYGRMSEDNETIAIRSAGVSPVRLLGPAFCFGAAGFLFTLYVSLDVLPHSYRAFRDLVFRITRESILSGLQEGTFNNDFPGLALFFQRMGPDHALEGVLLEDRRPGAETRLVVARGGRLAFDPDTFGMTLRLTDGTIHIVPPDEPNRYRVLSFLTYELRAGVGGRLARMAGRARDRKELDVAELRRAARDLRAQGQSDARQWVEIHRRFAIPAACLLLSPLGAALGLRMRRARRGIGAIVGLLIGLGYFAALAGGEDLGVQGRLAPALAVWFPDGLLAAVCLWLVALGIRDSPIRGGLALRLGKPQPAR